MSYHKRPHSPELLRALKNHGLEHDKPSQLSDAFRTGWWAKEAMNENCAAEERKALSELLKVADALIADMRKRAIMRGDFEAEELPIIGGMGATKEVKIATLDCGNSVLIAMSKARQSARAILDNDGGAS